MNYPTTDWVLEEAPRVDECVANRKIVTNKRYFRDIADDAWNVILRSADETSMYLRGLDAVELLRDANGRIAIVKVTREALRDTLDRVADFVKESQDKYGVTIWSPNSPPIAVVSHMLAHLHPEIPVLKDVVEVPVFSSGGQLLQKQGYHRSARIYVDLPQGFRMSPVPRNPNSDHVDKALTDLLEP